MRRSLSKTALMQLPLKSTQFSTSYRINRVVSHNRITGTAVHHIYCILMYFIVKYNIIKSLLQAASHNNIILPQVTCRCVSLVFFGFYIIIETRLVTPSRLPRATSRANQIVIYRLCLKFIVAPICPATKTEKRGIWQNRVRLEIDFLSDHFGLI